jgi:hypothetical protein
MRFLIFLLLVNLNSHGQEQIPARQLYYFISKYSLVGVKDNHGKIIIPAISHNFSRHRNKELITDDLIYMMPLRNAKSEPHSWGVVYGRSGKKLFAPFFFDNGPDYLAEGLMRYVDNKKVGFVNRLGQKIIEAKYDFVSIFDYGIASFCNGCEWAHLGEHSYVRGGVWGYINKKDQEVKVTKHRKTLKDQVADSTGFLPYQFSYNSFEKKIIDSFYKLSLISKIHFVNYYSPLDNNERILHYEIVERPSDLLPYYHVKGFEFTNKSGYHGTFTDLNFYVSKDGKNYFAEEYYEKIPLQKWLDENIAEAKEFMKTHEDALYKF